VKILLDVNLPDDWIAALRACGWQSEPWRLHGSTSALDPAILEFAASEGYVLMSRDLDFGELLARSGHGEPSVVLLRAKDIRPAMLAVAVCRALTTHATALESGAIVTVYQDRSRVRRLPLDPAS
jgi:predicted nuclease of predicted toxin-antitoxin system